jgi:hypothetical protein
MRKKKNAGESNSFSVSFKWHMTRQAPDLAIAIGRGHARLIASAFARLFPCALRLLHDRP